MFAKICIKNTTIEEGAVIEPTAFIYNSTIGKRAVVRKFTNIYGSEIGENTKVAAFVEIAGAKIGKACKIEAHAFIPPGVVIGDNVFVGPHVCFTNDKLPRASSRTWQVRKTFVRDGASIGANSTILSGIEIGTHAMIGAGSVVCEDVPSNTVMYGSKAEVRRSIR
jgi:acetyltransferase-like isoleucine patch superfamily enzyme